MPTRGVKRRPVWWPGVKFESNLSLAVAFGPTRASRRGLGETAPLAEQKLDVSRQGLWRDLLEGALLRRLVGAEADELGAVAESVAGDVVVTHTTPIANSASYCPLLITANRWSQPKMCPLHNTASQTT